MLWSLIADMYLFKLRFKKYKTFLAADFSSLFFLDKSLKKWLSVSWIQTTSSLTRGRTHIPWRIIDQIWKQENQIFWVIYFLGTQNVCKSFLKDSELLLEILVCRIRRQNCYLVFSSLDFWDFNNRMAEEESPEQPTLKLVQCHGFGSGRISEARSGVQCFP